MVPELSHFPTAWKKYKYAVSLFLARSLNVKGFFTYRSKASQLLRRKKNNEKKSLVFLVSVAQTYVEVNGRGKRGKAEVQAVSSSELG